MEVGLMRDTGSFLVEVGSAHFGELLFFITAGHTMHSEAEVPALDVISWCSLQDLLTCPVLKEGVNHTR